MLGAGALGRPRGLVWGGRREECSGWGTRVYLWQIHVDIWQNQYNIVKLKNKKIKIKKKAKQKKKVCELKSSLLQNLLQTINNKCSLFNWGYPITLLSFFRETVCGVRGSSGDVGQSWN